MRAVVSHQLRRIWAITTATLLCLWSLIALFVYTATVQYGEKDCWFSVFRIMQVLMPVAAVLPLSFWIDPFFSEQSAELLHSLPEIHHALFCILCLLIPALWLCTVVLPLATAWFLLPEFSLLTALVRCSAQVLFSQALFMVSGALLRSTLNGMTVLLLTNGAMLLSIEIPAAHGTVFQTFNLFESFSFTNQNPFSIGKEALILALAVLLLVFYRYRMRHYFSHAAEILCHVRQRNK